MSRITTYILTTCVLLTALSINSAAQSISASGTTPAANTARCHNVSVSYMIGHLGSGVIRVDKPINTESTPQKGELKAAKIEIQAYPNPFTEAITVRFNYSSDAPRPAIQLIDNTGRIVETESQFSVSDGKARIWIPGYNIPQGQYIIRITTGGSSFAVSAIKI